MKTERGRTWTSTFPALPAIGEFDWVMWMDCDSYFQNTNLKIEHVLELAHIEWWLNKKNSDDGDGGSQQEQQQDELITFLTNPRLHELLFVSSDEKAAVKVGKAVE